MKARSIVPAFLLLAAAPAAASAQGRDTVVVAGPQYRASDFGKSLFGSDYRDLWTAPVRVPFLDLRHYAGGLTPLERGGGRQTRSLHLKGADGKEYRFRSVDKRPQTAQEPALRGGPVGRLVQDQTSSLNPAGALLVPPLLDAVNVLHVTPALYVMPDDPVLGPFRAEFAGMLGQLEEAPNEGAGDTPGFGGFRKIIGTEKLLENLEASPGDRIDARAYLTARLMDLLLNDWDRNPDNWRWARRDSAGVHLWVALPRDRDYATVDYDGLVSEVLRRFVRNAVGFSDQIHNVYGLTLNARVLDRRLLAELDRAAWDSVALSVQARLTDAVIDRAVARMPEAYRALEGAELTAKLKSRRASLPHAAHEFYRLLATDVDVQATDERDLALVDRLPDGSVLVRLYDAAEPGRALGPPYYSRRFLPEETGEVRIDLHGGRDRALVRGVADRSLTVRVEGGGGDDVLVDSSTVRRGAKTGFYDARGENRFVRGPVTHVSTRRFTAPESGRTLSGEGYRDWGHTTGVVPTAGWRGEDGPIVGATYTYQRFGYRKVPYATLLAVTGRVGLLSGALGAQAYADRRLQNSAAGYSLGLLASQLESIRFFGFGNDTPARESSDYYIVRQDRLRAEAAYHVDLPGGAVARVGPVVELTRSQLPVGTPFAAAFSGDRNYGQAGATAEYALDRRDDPAFPRRGAALAARASAWPALWSVGSAFASARAVASGYWTPVAAGPTLALRLGGEKVTGGFPIHEAAFLGGSSSLRGYTFQRFAGDAATFANAEVRVPVDSLRLVLRGRFGLTGLADFGRVYYHGESEGGWHRALGGGLWFASRLRTRYLAASVTYARGEADRVYVKLSAPF